MIRQLRRRLLWLFSLATIFFLTVILIMSFLNSVRQLQVSQELFFRNQCDAAVRELERYPQHNESVFSVLEDQFGMVIHISGQYGIIRESKHALQTSIDILLETFIDSQDITVTQFSGNEMEMLQTNVASIKGQQGERYLCAIIALHDQTNGALSMYMIYPLPSSLSAMGSSVWIYPGMWIIAVIAVFLLSRLLVQQAIRPVEQSMRSQKEFIAAASHELKSPLAVIRAHVEELNDGQTTTVIQSECDRMSRLIQDMLMLAATDSGTWNMRNTPFSMENVLIEAYEKYQPLANAKNIVLEIELPESMLCEIHGDRERIEQVLGILLDNAISYSQKNTPIRIRVEARKDTIAVSIIDHGLGISDTDKAHVFERFYRIDRSRTQKEHFGLGLSIAQEIMHLHNGSIDIRDTVGGGATFVLIFPCKYKTI